MKQLVQFLAAFLILTMMSFHANADILYTGSKTYGGGGGQSFTMPEEINISHDFQAKYIKKVSIKVSFRIEKIQVNWATRSGQDMVEATGENGGTWKHIYLSKGEFITKVTGRSGRFVNQLTFYTNSGRQFGPYGGCEGTPFQITAPKGHEVIGFFGNSGQCIDKIGLIYRFDTDKENSRKRPSTGSRQGHTPSKKSIIRPGTVPPRPSKSSDDMDAQNKREKVIDHRESIKGNQKTRPNTIDHRKEQEAERKKWMKDNFLDPDRAGG